MRVAYIDNDPIVHVHANALLTGQGSTSIVLADLRNPQSILTHPGVRELIDFNEPVALLLIAIMHFITDEEDPRRIISTFRSAFAPGSYLALSHATADFHSDVVTGGTVKVYDSATAPLRWRSHAEVSALFDGWELIEPGLVQVPLWRPEQELSRARDLAKIAMYGGAGQLAP